MTTDAFAAIREAVSARAAYERYVGSIGRNGRARCLWHSPDNHPSLSLKGSSCRCFACGGGGSSIDLAMQLFGLDLKAAAAKLNADFALGLDLDAPVPAAEVRKAQADRELVGRLEAWMRRAWLDLCAYRLALLALADRFGGVTIANADLPELTAVLEDLAPVERLLDEHAATWGRGLEVTLAFYKLFAKEAGELVRNNKNLGDGGRDSRGA